jgi:hypothetical protein
MHTIVGQAQRDAAANPLARAGDNRDLPGDRLLVWIPAHSETP